LQYDVHEELNVVCWHSLAHTKYGVETLVGGVTCSVNGCRFRRPHAPIHCSGGTEVLSTPHLAILIMV
jgi:hypothetical protein